MYDPCAPSASTNPARVVITLVALQLAVITELARERDSWRHVADSRAGAVEHAEAADELAAFWRDRALHAEEALRDVRAARATHVCKEKR